MALTQETAQEQVDGWLDFKKVNQLKRQTFADHMKIIVGEVMEGNIVIDDQFKITQSLRSPVGNKQVVKLLYSPFLQMSNVHAQMKGVKSNDADGRVTAYIASITGQQKELIKKMDSQDFATGQAIAIFYN